jgi:thioredoxin reductase
MTQFDFIIVGSGAGGLSAALLAQISQTRNALKAQLLEALSR